MKKQFMVLSALNTMSANLIREFDKLVVAGFDINSDISGSSPIHEISRYGYEDFLNYLITNGADVDGKDWESRTALMICMEFGHWQCFKILVSSGAKYGMEISMWKEDGNRDKEDLRYLNQLIAGVMWEKRKGIVFVYSKKIIKIPQNVFRELLQFL